jgi:hypothetical protein
MSPSQGEDFRCWAFISRRAFGHLVVDLGDEALKRTQRDYTFFVSEDLYGRDGIKPPTK